MRLAKWLLVLPFLVLVLWPFSAIAEPSYQSGTLLGIEKKVKITPLEYVFEVVASYYETVTYELKIQVGEQLYYADYTPNVQPNGPLPVEWTANRALGVRVEKHRLFVKLSYDGEIETFIARRERVKRL
jgi:hypothetical protein